MKNKRIIIIVLCIFIVVIRIIQCFAFFCLIAINVATIRHYSFEMTIKHEKIKGVIELKEYETLKTAGLDIYYVPDGRIKRIHLYSISYRDYYGYLSHGRFTYRFENEKVIIILDAHFFCDTMTDDSKYVDLISVVSSYD